MTKKQPDIQPGTKTVLVRIRRWGPTGWASTSVGIFPPKHRLGEHDITALCTPLVPGQVVELPEDHDLVNDPINGDTHPVVEIVRRPAKDEIIRPWVYESSEAAIYGDPQRSTGRSAAEIQQGLHLMSGAVQHQRQKEAIRKQAQEAAGELDDEFYDDEPTDDMEADMEPASVGNRHIADEPLEDEETVPVRRGRGSGRGRK